MKSGERLLPNGLDSAQVVVEVPLEGSPIESASDLKMTAVSLPQVVNIVPL